jgi:AcrR family transcriptional regulator
LKKNRTKKAEIAESNILEAASLSIGEIGIESSSITEIAKRANVSRSLVAHYFPKKASLLKNVIIYISKRAYTQIESPSPKLSDEKLVLEIAKKNLNFFLNHPHYYHCFMIFYHYSAIKSDLRKLNTELFDRAIFRIENLLTSRKPAIGSKEARFIAEQIYNEYFFGIQRHFTLNQKKTRRELENHILDRIRAILAQS